MFFSSSVPGTTFKIYRKMQSMCVNKPKKKQKKNTSQYHKHTPRKKKNGNGAKKEMDKK